MLNPYSTNFIGKDPMHWWIGQVTDPKKGKWEALLERFQAKDPDKADIYSHRVRVRIVGYHGDDADLPDEDLPLAHVLLPPNTTVTAGTGPTLQYQGGEVVVGFFFDGEDGQQPVIFGTLFRQPYVKDRITKGEFDAFKQTSFKPYTPPAARQNAGGHQFGQGNSPVEFAQGGGEVVEAISNKKKEYLSDDSSSNYTACEDNEISKISGALKEFSKKLQVLESLNTADVFSNPVYGGIVDMKQEIQITSNKIQNSMTNLIRRGRSWVIQETLDKMSTTLSEKVPKPNQAPTAEAMSALTNTIFCNFEKIQDELGDYLNKSLENMLGSLLDVPICGIENFLGDMFGQINNILDTNLGSIFNQLNAIQGGGIALPSKTFTKAIKFTNIITNVLDCDRQQCPENNTFSPKNGYVKDLEDSFDNIIGNMGLSSLADPLLDKIDNAIPASPSKPDCSTNVLRCGPPRVDFIGGGGQGASGSAIVNTLGQVIGVAISDGGFGFTEPPLLTFFDSCENGFGAGGFVRIKDGSVTDVIMSSPGQQYLPNTTETTLNEDGTLTEKEILPDPNANYDGEVSYVTSLSDVVVENTGFGYEDTDTLTVDGAEVELDIRNGSIIGANIKNSGFGFTSLPDLVINSDTGAGARLKPVLKFTKVDDASQLAEITQDAVVTVISCIEK